MRCQARSQGDGRRRRFFLAGSWDAKRAGACRSGRHATGGSAAPRRGIARREGRRAGARGLRVVRLCVRSGGRQEHLDSAAAAAVFRIAHGKDRRRGGSEDQEAEDRINRRRWEYRRIGRVGLPGSRPQRRRGLPGRGASRRAAPIAASRRRLPRLRCRDRLREGPGRAGPDHRAAPLGGHGVPAAEAALPPVRPGLHRGRARRGRPEEVRCHGRQHDRPVEVRQRTAVQPPRRPAGGLGRPAAGLDPVGHRGGGGRRSWLRPSTS